MKRVLNLKPIGGNVWRAELVTPDGTKFVAIVQAPDQLRAWELAMEQEPDTVS